MNNYDIKKIDISNLDLRSDMTALVNDVFNLNLYRDDIYLNTFTRNGNSVYLGAFHNEKLVAINIFIAHELLYNNKNVIAFQSCWSATSKNHRKKGLFTLLINKAKEILDGAFIFGFPNHNSEPIFLKKLGFRRVDLAKINLPSIFLPKLILNNTLKNVSSKYSFPIKNVFIPLEAELIDLKKAENKNEIISFQSYNNIVWGKINKRQTKMGRLNFFNVGGIQVNKPHLLPNLFLEMMKNKNIDFIQIIASSNSSLWDLFKYKSKALKTEPLIIYDLNCKTIDSRFNFITGIKDVF